MIVTEFGIDAAIAKHGCVWYRSSNGVSIQVALMNLPYPSKDISQQEGIDEYWEADGLDILGNSYKICWPVVWFDAKDEARCDWESYSVYMIAIEECKWRRKNPEDLSYELRLKYTK